MSASAFEDVAPAQDRAGLTTQAAAARLRTEGPNALPQDRQRGLVQIVLDALREPMLQLLLAAGVIYLFLGNLAEALILLGFAILNVALVAFQEGRTERALATLKDLTSPHAVVVRDGAQARIPARDLVAGDIIVLAEGDRVPADGVLLEMSHIEADESLLTGEAVPVRKAIGGAPGEAARPGGDDSPHVWSGTLIVQGAGIARVTATGPRTEVGRLGTSLGAVEGAPSPLQVQTRRLVRVFAAAGIGASALLVAAYGVLHGDWVEAILAGITLAMATLPEEFPLVLTIFLVLGAWRLSRSQVLARRMAAVEALGAATVLCTDKTGTLTHNRMSVARLKSADADVTVGHDGDTLPEAVHALVEFAILSSRPDSFDPMERAFYDFGERRLARREHVHADWRLARDYPLDTHLLAMSQVWKAKDAPDYIVAAKGAPEAIADLCHLPPDRLAAVRRDTAAMAEAGLRVLGVARASFSAAESLPTQQHDFDFVFLGLAGLSDPLRPGVPQAVADCGTAGIAVAMITGDHPATARAIAREANIAADEVLTGQAMAAMDDAALHAAHPAHPCVRPHYARAEAAARSGVRRERRSRRHDR